jgi:hypothetical protein
MLPQLQQGVPGQLQVEQCGVQEAEGHVAERAGEVVQLWTLHEAF